MVAPFGPFTLDVTRRRVSRGPTDIHLTHKAFELLRAAGRGGALRRVLGAYGWVPGINNGNACVAPSSGVLCIENRLIREGVIRAAKC